MRIQIAIFVVPLIAVFSLALVSYNNLSNRLTDMVFSRRASLAHLSALAISARLNNLLNLGVSLAARDFFYSECAAGRWQNGLSSMEKTTSGFPEIDRIFVTTADGTVKADFPPVAGAVGKNAAHQKWYEQVKKTWKPLISDVYKRMVEPRYNVVATVVPLKKDDGTVFGIFVMQTRIDKISEFSEWQQESDLGKQGFVYVVDHTGNVVSHPKYSKQDAVVNLANVPVVAKVLAAKKGVDTEFDPVAKHECISAYEPVGNFGWGVVAQEPLDEALMPRNEALRQLWIVYGGAAAASLLFSFLLVSGLRALWVSEERFRLTVETTREWIWAIDREWRVTYSNPALYSILGYFPEEVVGRVLTDGLIADEDRSEVVDEFIPRALREATGWTSHLMRFRHKSGEIRALESNAVPIFDSHRVLEGFRGATRDVTERQRIEEEMKKARDMALELARAKSDFLAVMSHEIRTPMNGVIGMINLLADSELTEIQRDCVETIRSSGEALLVVINDILNFSKIESGNMLLEHSPFNLRECIEDMLDVFVGLIREKRIEVAYQIAPDVPATMLGDAARLRQILVNLLGNALKFTSAGEIVIHVQAEARDDGKVRVIFSVADSGIGIPAEALGRIFESFHQLDSTTSRRYGGTGLGLAISKRLSELMGGTMWVESETGVGSTFFFDIITEAAPILGNVGIEPEPDLLRAHQILVVDDNATNRRILVMQLTEWGKLPTAVASGADALETLAAQKFDLVLIDMQMPEMDGIELAHAIRARDPALPLGLLSSAGDVADTEGLFLFQIPKPVKQSALYEAIQRATGIVVERKAPGKKHFDIHTAERWPLRILLAEDNHVNQKVGLLTLGQLGYRADLADDGFQVLERLAEMVYDLVLMDVQMPGMDGLEALEKILADFPEKRPAIVALTANALEGDRDRMIAAGFDDYLSKPLQPSRLSEVLHDAFVRKQR